MLLIMSVLCENVLLINTFPRRLRPIAKMFTERQYPVRRFVSTESGGTVVSPRTSHLGDPSSILARGWLPREGYKWLSFPLQVNTVQIGE